MALLKDNSMEPRMVFNGKFLPSQQPVAGAQNRGLRYGDGVFETMKLIAGNLLHASLHFERLFKALADFQFEWPPFFSPAFLEEQVLELAKKNGHEAGARVRLMVFRGNGGLYDPENHIPQWLIETTLLPHAATKLNENGLVIGIHTRAIKPADGFSAHKTNNFLPYLTAALHAKSERWNDALVLNQAARIADSTIANVFWMEKETLFTPPLDEGPVAGTVRRRLLERLPALGWDLREEPASPERLASANAVFLTNAIYGLRWVAHLNNASYEPGPAPEIFSLLHTTI